MEFFLLNIFEKNDIYKTCRSCFEKMFLFAKVYCQPQRKRVIENKMVFGGPQEKACSSSDFRDIENLKLSMNLVNVYIY